MLPTNFAPSASWYTRVPIEGAGVVHVVTDPLEAGTDVILRCYQGAASVECVHLRSSGGSPESAEEMHTFWSDLETLTFCVRRAPIERYFCNDEYMERKFRQLFGRGFY